MENPGDREEFHLTAKSLLISPTRKTLLNKFTSSVIKNAISSPSNSNFHLITLCKLHLWLQPLLLYQFCINFRFTYRCVTLILINWCLLNVVFSITKALIGQNSPKQNFYSSHLLMLPVSPYACFPFFHTPFFISNFIKLQLTPLQLGFCGLSANQI